MPVAGAPARLPTPVPPDSDGLDVRVPGAAGGPMDVRFPTLGRAAFVRVTEGALVFEGVPVRGVEEAESCFVGDLVGD